MNWQESGKPQQKFKGGLIKDGLLMLMLEITCENKSNG